MDIDVELPLDEITENQLEEMLNKTKMDLFFSEGSGFIGSLMGTLGFRWTKKCKTAATDGVNIYWNPEQYRGLELRTRVTMLAHELWHVAYLHMGRRGDRDPELYNIAADHVINLMLQEHGYYMGGFPWYMDPRFRGMSTEEVYDVLYVENPPPPPSGGGGFGDPAAGGDGEGDDPFPNGKGDLIYIDDPNSPDGSAKLNKLIHKVVSGIQTAIITGQPGSVPGEVSVVIDRFLNPKLPWNVLVANWLTAISDPERSYRRPNRRYDDPIMPGQNEDENGLEHLLYFVDVSGSITDDQMLRSNSEVKYIFDTFRPKKLTLVTFDTEIQNVIELELDDPFDKLEITGRGGTDLYMVYEMIDKIRPTAAIIFTDLYVDIPEEEPKTDLLWVCVDRKGAEVPYGKLVEVNSR